MEGNGTKKLGVSDWEVKFDLCPLTFVASDIQLLRLLRAFHDEPEAR
jgi:hypothetical protein